MNPDTARTVLELIEEAALQRGSDPVGAQQASEQASDILAECWEDAQGNPSRKQAIRRFERWAWNQALEEV